MINNNELPRDLSFIDCCHLAWGRWIANIAGFDANILEYTLTKARIEAIQNLRLIVDKCALKIQESRKPIDGAYVQEIQSELDQHFARLVDSKEQISGEVKEAKQAIDNKATTIGWLCSYTMSFEKADKDIILNAFNDLNPEMQNILIALYENNKNVGMQPSGIPITYGPGTVKSIIEIAKNNNIEVVNALAFLATLLNYLIEDHAVKFPDHKAILCLREIANNKEIAEKLLKLFTDSPERIREVCKMDAEGNVTVDNGILDKALIDLQSRIPSMGHGICPASS
jgi:hypothetical protein